MKRNQGVRRGRAYIQKYISWLTGYPIERSDKGIVWQVVPHVGVPYQVVVDSQRLHETTRTWTKLVHRFPHALPQIVSDLPHWKSAVPQLVSLLSDAIHHDKPLPRNLQDNTMGDLLDDALSWMMYLYPDAAMIAWSAENRPLLDEITAREGLLTTLMVWELARRDGGGRIQRLLTIGTSEPIFMQEGENVVEQWRKALTCMATKGIRLNIPHTPDYNAPPKLHRFLRWLLEQRKFGRQPYLNLLDTLLPPNFYAEWAIWQHQFDPFEARATDALHKKDKKAAAKLVASLPKPPPQFKSYSFFNGVIDDEYNLDWVKTALPILSKLPYIQDGVLLRDRLFHQCYYQTDDPSFGTVIAQWAKRMLSHEMLPYTATLIAETNAHAIHEQINELLHAKLPEHRTAMFDLVTAATKQSEPSQFSGIYFLNLLPFWRIAHEADVDVALRCSNEWPEMKIDDDMFHGRHLLLAYLIADERPVRPIIEQIEKADIWGYDRITQLTDFVRMVDQLGWQDLIYQLVMSGNMGAIDKVVNRCTMLTEMETELLIPPPPVPTNYPAWIAHYPDQFAPVLATLAVITPQAEDVAHHILGKMYPQRDELQTEIAFLHRKAAEQPQDERLTKRITNLQTRLSHPPPLSAARRTKLMGKLQHALYINVLKSWQTETDSALKHALQSKFANTPLPHHLYQADTVHILVALTKLDGHFQSLGARLLSQPDNFLQEPANQRFVAQMERAGLAMSAWLNPAPPRPMTGENGRVLHVGFTADPIDILMMGEHFSTCLSMSSFNFFSTVANGVDVNKQVLYARDEQGGVVGRCLFTLSDEGGLLTFHPYCHDGSVNFGELVGRFALTLAEQLNTVVIPHGHVSCLVAHNWYDDGSMDLTGGFDCFKDNSKLRKQLGTVTAASFPDLLSQQLAPLPIGSLTIPMVLQLPEIQARPELALTLIPHVRQLKGYTNEVLFGLAVIAMQHNVELDFIKRVAYQRGYPLLRRHNRYTHDLQLQALRLMTSVHPSVGLRLLRRTREPHIHSDFDEYQDRRKIAATAHKRLNRPQLANQLQGK